jgi:hypothetical protein
MNGAFIRNFQQLGALFGGERSHRIDISFNPIKHILLGVAADATLTISSGHCFDGRTPQPSSKYSSPRPQTADCKAKSRISASFRYRFVGSQSVRAGDNFLCKSGRVASHRHSLSLTRLSVAGRLLMKEAS